MLLLGFHILAGTTALLAGYAAMFAGKPGLQRDPGRFEVIRGAGAIQADVADGIDVRQRAPCPSLLPS